ncbi:hypothetical protein B9Z55_022640 [Caenorhabditis nigoni]|uniref:Uncharacterized protein n=1 Tax=Caenorhabditis nigoni TaxID=1611254 RepID=A0A2G5SLK0_9PELO|nr:hypothetical protein B9Z55_022640 [Caenorhabditis nigoni]
MPVNNSPSGILERMDRRFVNALRRKVSHVEQEQSGRELSVRRRIEAMNPYIFVGHANRTNYPSAEQEEGSVEKKSHYAEKKPSVDIRSLGVQAHLCKQDKSLNKLPKLRCD